MNNTTRDWSNLSAVPLQKIDLMLNVSSALELLNQTVRFNHTVRLACKKWRNSVDPPLVMLHPFLPLLLTHQPQQQYPLDLIQYPPLRLVSTSVFLLRRKSEHPSPWWLVSVEKTKSKELLRLFHPLTRSRIPMEFLHDYINPNLEFVELSKGCNLRCYNGITPAFGHLPQDFCVSKVILWPEDPNDLLRTTYTVVMLCDHGKLDCYRVSFSYPEEHVGIYHVESETTISCQNVPNLGKGTTCDSSLKFDDVEIWKDGCLWAVDCQGKLYGISYYSLKVNAVGGGGIPVNKGGGSKRLLVALAKLYLVVCNGNLSTSNYLFTVYQLDEDFKWMPRYTLGGQILFVGYDTCFLGTTDLFEGFQRDSVVYPKRLYPMFSDNETRDGIEFHGQLDYLDLCVCSYQQSGIAAAQQLIDSPNLSSVFWPPPDSIFQNYVEGDQ